MEQTTTVSSQKRIMTCSLKPLEPAPVDLHIACGACVPEIKETDQVLPTESPSHWVHYECGGRMTVDTKGMLRCPKHPRISKHIMDCYFSCDNHSDEDVVEFLPPSYQSLALRFFTALDRRSPEKVKWFQCFKEHFAKHQLTRIEQKHDIINSRIENGSFYLTKAMKISINMTAISTTMTLKTRMHQRTPTCSLKNRSAES